MLIVLKYRYDNLYFKSGGINMEKLTMVRHGDIITGNRMGELSLSNKGQQQANLLAQQLKEDYDIMIVSDSIRTRETANILATKVSKPIVIEPLLNAWNAGTDDSNNYWNAYYEFFCSNGLPEKQVSWETFEQLKKRTMEGLLKYEKYDSILVITHSIIISLYAGISKKGITNCQPIEIDLSDGLKCTPPDFISIIQ